ncbi:3-phosphoserine/phosphohydroxythreonine transaminase [Pseudalkalibacillus sp. SCS-8]|uniref:3-phosphoserine/phosphohydroxythreonine transaminase n=1 Tax=Pseudalkalibacillus nanhaiensis TaxID=3115291 RepID=UPI0032DAF017
MGKLNFNPGPTALPLEVLQKAKEGLSNFADTGFSILELSHRSQAYQSIHDNATKSLAAYLNIPDSHDILLLQGGASLQFTMVPMNLLGQKKTAYHIVTGSWSKKAYKESKKIGPTEILASSKERDFAYIPPESEWKPVPESAQGYLHITSNNTIYGTQWRELPHVSSLPLVVDMSSDIGTKPIPWENVDIAYAGAQKNLGAAGVTVVVIRKDLLTGDSTGLPAMLDYRVHAEKGSLYNTPPTFNIFVLQLMVQWLNDQGGLQAFEARSLDKSKRLYDVIDRSDDFYIGHAERSSRSTMNVTFRLQDEELTKVFLSKANEAGIIGINGHRSMGGCRVSLYNGIGIEACERLVDFMQAFKRNYS